MLVKNANRTPLFVHALSDQTIRYGHRKMEYEEFIDYMKKTFDDYVTFFFKGFSGSDFFERQLVKGANRQFLHVDCSLLLTDMLVIQSSGKFYNLSDLYDLYLQEDLPEDFSDHQVPFLGHIKTGPYTDVKNSLIIQVYNYDLHQEGLENYVYYREGDLVFILYLFVEYRDKTLCARKITKFEFDCWENVSFDQVMTQALNNTAKIFPATVYHHDKKKEVDFLKDHSLTKENILYFNSTVLLSNNVAINGAMTLYYPGVVVKMMKLLNGPFDAVFMNINDVMIFQPDDELTEYAAEYAAKSSKMGEMLSGKIYRCDLSGVHPK